MRTLLLSIFIAVIIFPSQEITAQRKKKNTKDNFERSLFRCF